MDGNEATHGQPDQKFGTGKPVSRFAEVLIATRKLALFDAKTAGRLSSLRMWVIAAIRQILVNQTTFAKLVDERMASASVSMLRMQLDIGARTNALFLVEDPEDVARRVLQGEVLNRFRDREGKKLSDAYLFDRLLIREEKWKQLLERFRYLGCAHIHFSAAAVQRSIHRISDTDVEFRDVFEDDFANDKERQDTALAMEVVTHAAGEVVLDVFHKFPEIREEEQ